MSTNIVVPELGESVVDATVARWVKKEGDPVAVGEPVVELETDKVDLEVSAAQNGVLARISRPQGSNVKVGEVLGVLEDAAVAPAGPPKRSAEADKGPAPEAASEAAKPAAQPATEPAAKSVAETEGSEKAVERGVDLGEMTGTGAAPPFPAPEAQRPEPEPGPTPTAQPPPPRLRRSPDSPSLGYGEPAEALAEAEGGSPEPRPKPEPVVGAELARPAQPSAPRFEERVRMSRRRQTIARRLVDAQHTAAMLTTFNEVDMTAVVELRQRQKEAFKARHGVGLGIVSFFIKASIAALRAFPRLNAEVQGDEMVIKHYYDIGVAVGAPDGLVVPVLRDADRLSFSDMEKAIKEFARKAADGSLTLDDLRGGTFTITNGGVFGSLLSTPILNPPQVGILGLHKIEERPVAVKGQVLIRSAMYAALSYDHRIVDGLEAVQFLVKVKELVEDPARLLFES